MKKGKKIPEQEKKEQEELLKLREEARKRYLVRQERLKQIQQEQNSIEIQSLHTDEEAIPEEVLIVIFSFLDLKNICKNICLVCRGWNKVQKNNIIWESLYKKNFKTILLDGKEDQEGIWRENYENRAKIRFNWYKNKSASVVMDMKQEDFELFKKNTQFDGQLSIPKENLTSKSVRNLSYLYSISLFAEKIVTGDQNGCINVWNCRTAQIQSVLKGNTGNIIHTKVTKDNIFSSSSNDKKVFVWDVNYGLVKKKLRNNTNSNEPLLKFDIYENKLLYGNSNYGADIIDIETDKQLLALPYPHTQSFQVKACHLFENLFVTCGYGDGFINVYDTRAKICVKKIKTTASTKIKNPQNMLYTSAPNIESKSRLTAIITDYSSQTSLSTYDISTGKEIKSLILGGNENNNTISEGYDNEKIIRSNSLKTSVYHRDTGNLECFINHGNLASCVDFDEGRIVVGCSTGAIIYRNFGGSNFYWTGLGGGKTLGSLNDEKKEKMEIEEIIE